jgi:hypothetical protein
MYRSQQAMNSHTSDKKCGRTRLQDKPIDSGFCGFTKNLFFHKERDCTLLQEIASSCSYSFKETTEIDFLQISWNGCIILAFTVDSVDCLYNTQTGFWIGFSSLN